MDLKFVAKIHVYVCAYVCASVCAYAFECVCAYVLVCADAVIYLWMLGNNLQDSVLAFHCLSEVLNSDCQVWWQAPLPTETFCWHLVSDTVSKVQ